jgi:hypothetical protein
LEKKGIAPTDQRSMAAKKEIVKAGGTLSEGFHFDSAKGEFKTSQEKEAFGEIVKGLTNEMSSGDVKNLETIRRLDTASLAANPVDGAPNQARAVFFEHMTPEALKAANATAAKGYMREVQTKIGEVTRAITEDANQVRSIAAQAGISEEELMGVAQNSTTDESRAIVQQMRTAGIADPTTAARAVQFETAISKDPDLSAIRGTVSERSEKAVRKAKESRGERQSRGDRGGERPRGPSVTIPRDAPRGDTGMPPTY